MRPGIARWLSGLAAGVAMVAAVSLVIALLDPQVPAIHLLMLYLLAVMPVAVVWGIRLAAIIAVLSAGVYRFLFVAPYHTFRDGSSETIIAVGVFLVTAVVVGQLADRLRHAAVRAARLSEEQSALRRVATLVARPVPPAEIFSAVIRELGQLSGADLARMVRFEPDGTVTSAAFWSGAPPRVTISARLSLDGPSIVRGVRDAGGPFRIESFAGTTGTIAEEAQALGVRSAVGCPIVVAGRLWGAMSAARTRDEPFPDNTEAQLADFTELVVTAIENAQSREQLAASRARVVAATDDARRRLERDLHDGAQQRIIALTLELRLAQDATPPDQPEQRTHLAHITNMATETLQELREISRGLHPTILSERGLGPALRALARRSTIPVQLHIDTTSRYPAPIEIAAYYVVTEALTNTTKHAHATHIDITIHQQDTTLQLHIHDDGNGGAQPSQGTGLIGLRDRVEALNGTIHINSPTGHGTQIHISLPIELVNSSN